MKTATITDFRKNIKKHLDEVESDQDILILSGPKKRDFVVLTLEVFNAMEETAHLLSTPNNTAELMESLAQYKKGNASVKDIDFPEGPIAGEKKLAKKGSSTVKYLSTTKGKNSKNTRTKKS